MKDTTIAILGAGNMGASLLGGLIASGVAAENIWVTDLDQNKLNALQERYRIHTSQQNNDVINNAKVVILAVKPQILTSLMGEIRLEVHRHQPLIISIAAGVPMETLQEGFGASIPI